MAPRLCSSTNTKGKRFALKDIVQQSLVDFYTVQAETA